MLSLVLIFTQNQRLSEHYLKKFKSSPKIRSDNYICSQSFDKITYNKITYNNINKWKITQSEKILIITSENSDIDLLSDLTKLLLYSKMKFEMIEFFSIIFKKASVIVFVRGVTTSTAVDFFDFD